MENQLSEEKILELINSGYERENLDFKVKLDVTDTRSLLELAKDLFGFANYGGGHLVIGVTDQGDNLGLPLHFLLDQADIAKRVHRFISRNVDFFYREIIKEINGNSRKFAAIYVEPSTSLIVVSKDGAYRKNGKEKKILREGDAFTRRGTQTVRANSDDHEKIRQRLSLISHPRFTRLTRPERTFVRPLQKSEQLMTNLFLLLQYPTRIWSIPTRFRKITSALRRLDEVGQLSQHSFILRNKRLYTFSDLSVSDHPLLALASKGEIEYENTASWENDQDKWKWFIGLLNKVIGRFIISKGLIYHPENASYHFPFTPKKDEDVQIEYWYPYRTKRPRTIAKVYRTNGKILYIAHRGFRCNIRTISPQLFFQLDPVWIFTEDGNRRLVSPRRRSRYSTIFEHGDRNHAIFTLTLFWIEKLSKGSKIIKVQEEEEIITEIATKPFQAVSSFGIKDPKLEVAKRTEDFPTLEPYLEKVKEKRGR